MQSMASTGIKATYNQHNEYNQHKNAADAVNNVNNVNTIVVNGKLLNYGNK